MLHFAFLLFISRSLKVTASECRGKTCLRLLWIPPPFTFGFKLLTFSDVWCLHLINQTECLQIFSLGQACPELISPSLESRRKDHHGLLTLCSVSGAPLCPDRMFCDCSKPLFSPSLHMSAKICPILNLLSTNLTFRKEMKHPPDEGRLSKLTALQGSANIARLRSS